MPAAKKNRKPIPMECPEGHVIVTITASQVVRYHQTKRMPAAEWERLKSLGERAAAGDREAERDLNTHLENWLDVNDVHDADDVEDADASRRDPSDTRTVLEQLVTPAPDEHDEGDDE